MKTKFDSLEYGLLKNDITLIQQTRHIFKDKMVSARLTSEIAMDLKMHLVTLINNHNK